MEYFILFSEMYVIFGMSEKLGIIFIIQNK